MKDERKEYVFTWFIENYSYCWRKNGLFSPEFIADDFKGTTWYLAFFPTVLNNENKGSIVLYLKDNQHSTDFEAFSLEYELSVLAADGTFLHSDGDTQIFANEKIYRCLKSPHTNEVFVGKNSHYSPQDCLRVRCKMWNGEGSIQPLAQITARTRIGIEQVSFHHVVERFCEFKPNQKKTIQIISSSKKVIALTSTLYFTDGPCCDGKIIVEITPSNANRILSKCKFYLLDRSGKKIECGEIDKRLEFSKMYIKSFLLSLTRQDILDKKSEYMPDDKLTLLCKCTFSTGVEYEKIERTIYEKPCSAVCPINVEDQDNTINALNPSHCPSVLDELKRIYNKLHLTDVQLKTKTKSFPVHKLLLCARSSVFNALLTNGMKKKNADIIEVDDIEDDILQQFLHFLYTDNVDDLQWESAIKLYNTADKYKVEKLKILCSCFLIDNLNTSNVCELLILADTHNDSNFKNNVESFILEHEEKIFASEEWGSLMETNLLLASKTMRLKYIRKLIPILQ